MKLQTFVFSLAASVALCQNVTDGSDLIDVLRSDPETLGFGQLLGDYPDLVTNLDPTKRWTVFAPSNEAVAAFRQSYGLNGSLVSNPRSLHRRDIPEYAAAIALLFTDRSNQANINTQQRTDVITNLTDPAFISLTPLNDSATLREDDTEEIPPPTEGHVTANTGQMSRKRSFSLYSFLFRRQIGASTISVSSGFGKLAAASLSETLYKNGGIRKVDSFFTIFGDLEETLQQTNGTAFANALSRAGVLDSLSKNPRITIFAPNDAALRGQNLSPESLKRYVLLNRLGTTPRLTTGLYNTSAGDSVNIVFRPDGSISVNNATIVKSDVMIKNGVIHYIDSAYTETFTGSAPGITVPAIAIAIAMLVSSMSIF